MNSCIVGILSPSHRQRAKSPNHNGDPGAGRPSAFPVPSGLWSGQYESLCLSLMYAHFYLELPAQVHVESWLHRLFTDRLLLLPSVSKVTLGSSLPFTVRLATPEQMVRRLAGLGSDYQLHCWCGGGISQLIQGVGGEMIEGRTAMESWGIGKEKRKMEYRTANQPQKRLK